MSDRTIVAGTRGSPLALWQAGHVIALIKERFPDQPIETRVIRTEGDRRSRSPLAKIGGRGVFVKEIEAALLSGEVDFAVHSLKDLPSAIPVGLVLAAIPERADARDVLVSRHGSLSALPQGARIGASSPRRAAQLLSIRPDIQIVPIRGNLGSRIRKGLYEDLDGTILAAAGLVRLGETDKVAEYLPLGTFLPAVGQGALAVEARSDDPELISMLATINDPYTSLAIRAERGFLEAVGGGCQIPIAAYARVQGDTIVMRAMLAPEGSGAPIWGELSGPTSDPLAVGKSLAAKMMESAV